MNAPRISRQILAEPYVPDRLAERLATNLDAGVAMAANENLGRTDVQYEPTPVRRELPVVQAYVNGERQEPASESATRGDEWDDKW